MFMVVKHKYIFGVMFAIMLLAAFLRLWDIGGPDIASDDALYSFRAVGYLDYVAAINRQSTPVTWFEEEAWWQKLSFHDAPPLVFAAQWLFFQTGGESVFVARLPFVIAGLLSVFFIFILGRYTANVFVGIAAALSLAIMNYALWISKIGLLDGFLVLWIILSLYFFLRARDKPAHYLWWGVFFGLGVLTKYTFLFMGPVFLTALILWQREAFKKKWFYGGILGILLLITPLIIYNVQMWQTRGHLDAALSTLIGQKPDDFKSLTRETSTDFNITAPLIEIAGNNVSAGVQLLFLVSFLVLLRASFRNEGTVVYQWILLLGFLWAVIMLSVVGAHNRFGVALIPFIVLIIAQGGVLLWGYMRTLWGKRLFMALALIVLIWEGVFTFQSQLLITPFVDHGLFVAENRPRRDGYSQLESYVSDFYKKFPEPFYFLTFSGTPQLEQLQREYLEPRIAQAPDAPQQKQLLVFDDRMEWFPTMWTFERRFLYTSLPILSLGAFLENVRVRGAEFYTQLGLYDVVFIMTTPQTRQNEEVNNKILQSFGETLEANNKLIGYILGPRGETAFTVYRTSL